MQPPPPPPPPTPSRGKLQLQSAPNAATRDATTQTYISNPPTGNYRIRWRGKTTEEMPIALILKKTETGELGMLTQIEVNARWLTIRNFLAEHQHSEKERIATATREAEEERSRQIATARRDAEEERSRHMAETVRAAAEQKRVAEENAGERARQHELESEKSRAQPTTQQGTTFCRYCGNQILATAAMCMKCGSPIGSLQNGMSNNNSTVTQKSRTAYVLLALFLGGLGMHNFYAGYFGRGITQLLICIFLGWLIFPIVILFIWILIEVFTVKQDPNGQPFN